MLLLLLGLVALVTAALSTVAGLGGGILLLAVLHLLGVVHPIPTHAAIQLVANGTRIATLFGHVPWRRFRLFALASLPGPWLIGMPLVDGLDEASVRALFGAFSLYAGLAPRFGLARLGPTGAVLLGGFLGGALGVVVGAVGPLTAPFLVVGSMGRREAVALLSVTAAWLHVLKLAAFAGWREGVHLAHGLPLDTVAVGVLGVVAGVFVGRGILERVDDRVFRRLVRVVLVVFGVYLVGAWLLGLLGGLA